MLVPYLCFSPVDAPPAIIHKGPSAHVIDIVSLNDPGTMVPDLLMDLGGVSHGRNREDWRTLGLIRCMLATRGCYLIFIYSRYKRACATRGKAS